MTGLSEEQEQILMEAFGPQYKFSQFKRGEMLRYGIDGSIYVGKILWVQSPSEQAGVNLPMRYVVAPLVAEDGGQVNSFVDIVFTLDVLRDPPA
jgi:hypothetical protein